MPRKETTPAPHSALLFAVVLCVLGGGTAQAAHELDGRDLAAGETLYQEQCAACHGADLEGQADWRTPGPDGVLPAPPHDATGHTWHHDTVMLFQYVKFGGQALMDARGIAFASGMPAFGETLSNDEILDTLAFIRSTWPADIQEAQAARNPPHD